MEWRLNHVGQMAQSVQDYSSDCTHWLHSDYPKFDTTQQWANVPSKELSDALVKTFKDKLKTDWQERKKRP